jgi:tRNA pseudouridine55 synthase
MKQIGFINLNKQMGFTSHDCVAKIRRILNIKKVGHGGTLDPLATGVLPIAIGKATRLLQFLPTNKKYEARIKFGMVTNTDDLEGEVISRNSSSHLTLEEIKHFLPQFIGKVEQIPPAFSAIKKDGKKLYQLARKGEKINIPKREVEIFKIDVLNWYPGEFPELELAIACGSGTYIRAIARDLGKILNVGGTLAGLNRTLSCGMTLENSFTLEEIVENHNLGKVDLIPPDFPLKYLPKITLKNEEVKRWCQGQTIIYNEELEGDICLVYDQNQLLLGIGKITINSDHNLISPKIVF